MDFYSNEFCARAEIEHRLAERRRAALHWDAAPSSATSRAKGRGSRQWTREFAAWVVTRARIGDTFTSRTPMNP